jgi:hypothetical protein
MDLFYYSAYRAVLFEKYSGSIINFTTLLTLQINMQQNNFNKEFKIDSAPRERPLQKSMLLLENINHSSSPNSRINPL